jgi:WD40 repeat protein
MPIHPALVSIKGRLVLAAGAVVLLASVVNDRFPGVLFATDSGHSRPAEATEIGILQPQGNLPGGELSAVTLEPAGLIAATGSRNGEVCLWRVEEPMKPLARWQAHPGKVTATTISLDGRRIFTAGADQSLRAWDITLLDAPRFIGIWPTSGLVTAASIAPDGHTLALAFGDRLEVGELARDRLIITFVSELPSTQLRALAFAPDGNSLAGGGGGDNSIRVWSLTSCGLSEQISLTYCAEHWVRGLAYSASGDTLVSLDTEGCVLAWNRDGRMIGETRAGRSSYFLAALSAGGQTILTRAVSERSARLSRFPDHWRH